jgi:hypothetical protein
MSHSILRNSTAEANPPKWADGYVIPATASSLPINIRNINEFSIQVSFTQADGYLTLQVSNHIENEAGTLKADQPEGWNNWDWNTAPGVAVINTATATSPQLIRYTTVTERWMRLLHSGGAPLTVSYVVYQGKSYLSGD